MPGEDVAPGGWDVVRPVPGHDSPLSSSSTQYRGEGGCEGAHPGAEINMLMGEQRVVFERLLDLGGAEGDRNAVCARFSESLRACQAAVTFSSLLKRGPSAPEPQSPFLPHPCSVSSLADRTTLNVGLPARELRHAVAYVQPHSFLTVRYTAGGRGAGPAEIRGCYNRAPKRRGTRWRTMCTCAHATRGRMQAGRGTHGHEQANLQGRAAWLEEPRSPQARPPVGSPLLRNSVPTQPHPPCSVRFHQQFRHSLHRTRGLPDYSTTHPRNVCSTSAPPCTCTTPRPCWE